jgi:hypothetical protein
MNAFLVVFTTNLLNRNIISLTKNKSTNFNNTQTLNTMIIAIIVRNGFHLELAFLKGILAIVGPLLYWTSISF